MYAADRRTGRCPFFPSASGKEFKLTQPLTPTVAPPSRDALREQLAALAHEQWSGWMRYLFGKCTYPGPSGVRMPSEWAERWMRQMNTPYAELSEAEKESDRLEADRVLDLVSLLAVPPPQEAPHQHEIHEDLESRVGPRSLTSDDGIYRDPPTGVVTHAERTE